MAFPKWCQRSGAPALPRNGATGVQTVRQRARGETAASTADVFDERRVRGRHPADRGRSVPPTRLPGHQPRRHRRPPRHDGRRDLLPLPLEGGRPLHVPRAGDAGAHHAHPEMAVAAAPSPEGRLKAFTVTFVTFQLEPLERLPAGSSATYGISQLIDGLGPANGRKMVKLFWQYIDSLRADHRRRNRPGGLPTGRRDRQRVRSHRHGRARRYVVSLVAGLRVADVAALYGSARRTCARHGLRNDARPGDGGRHLPGDCGRCRTSIGSASAIEWMQHGVEHPDGFVSLRVLRDTTNPRRVTLVEEWTDRKRSSPRCGSRARPPAPSSSPAPESGSRTSTARCGPRPRWLRSSRSSARPSRPGLG